MRKDHRTSVCGTRPCKERKDGAPHVSEWERIHGERLGHPPGNVTQLQYPTGRIVNYSYDSADRPSTASDSSNGVTYVTDWKTPPASTSCISTQVCYTPQGEPYSMSLGQSSSFNGINVSESFNNRLQPNEIKATAPYGNVLDLTYNFVDPTSGKNAGVVYGINNVLNTARSQSFTYDQLNRILTAGTSSTTGTYCWGYQYSYDPYGNLLSQAGASNYSGCTQTTMGTVTADGGNHISGLSYDTAGNTLTDGNYTYTYDAKSQLKTAAGVTYAYDGDGRRASKVGSKLYWYGSGGEILGETDGAGNVQNEYIFFGGKRIAIVHPNGDKWYYVEDFLGTSKAVASIGMVCYDADFTPFGSEKLYTNACSQNYKFEGKERDAETQNDDFGAREYSWRFGRWLSSDWSAVPEAVPYANLTNPQTLNLYAMVTDDPESFADLDGHIPPAQQTSGSCIQQEAANCLSNTSNPPQQNPQPPTTPVSGQSNVVSPPSTAPAQNQQSSKAPDNTATAAEKAAYQQKQALTKEFGGVIYEKNGTVSFTKPKHISVSGRNDSESTAINPNDRPKGSTVLALYHSHSSNTPRSNEFSPDDLTNAWVYSAQQGRSIPDYIGDARGGVYRYTPDINSSSPASDAEGRASGQIVTIVEPRD